MLIGMVAAMVLILGVSAAYANSTQNTGTGAGDDNGAQVAGHEDSDEPGDTEDAD